MDVRICWNTSMDKFSSDRFSKNSKEGKIICWIFIWNYIVTNSLLSRIFPIDIKSIRKGLKLEFSNKKKIDKKKNFPYPSKPYWLMKVLIVAEKVSLFPWVEVRVEKAALPSQPPIETRAFLPSKFFYFKINNHKGNQSYVIET